MCRNGIGTIREGIAGVHSPAYPTGVRPAGDGVGGVGAVRGAGPRAAHAAVVSPNSSDRGPLSVGRSLQTRTEYLFGTGRGSVHGGGTARPSRHTLARV